MSFNMATVTVLLSAYNGERYIAEQLESIVCQRGVSLRLVIRDDGSKDGTPEIIERFARKYPYVSFYRGDNLGAANSFLDLAKNAGVSDYYAFSDQDDVWEEDKLVSAVEKLEKADKSIPLLYFGNLKVTDEVLTVKRLFYDDLNIPDNKYAALAETFPSGCTEVFNIEALKLLNSYSPQYCGMHDSWLYILCSMFGKVIYDEDAHILYRQHGDNVIGTGKKGAGLIREKAVRLTDRSRQPRYNTARSLLEGYKDHMSAEDIEVVTEITDYKKSLLSRAKLLTEKRIKAGSVSRDIKNRLLIAAGLF